MANTAFAEQPALITNPQHASDRSLQAFLKESGFSLRTDTTLPPYTAIAGNAGAPQTPTNEQAYQLQITHDSIQLAGGALAGFRYGIHTLRQLFMNHAQLPAIAINDAPHIARRYFHDDCSRGQMPTLHSAKSLIDNLALYRYNALTLYIEDVVDIPGHPDISAGRGGWTTAELQEIITYADDFGIEVFPTFSLLGHHHNLLAQPRYRSLAAEVFQPPSALNPASPELRPLVEKILSHLCDIFPSRYFHMGFDEVIGLTEDAFIEHVNWCAETLVARGKQPVMWIDMFYNHFAMEALKKVHPQVISCPWAYEEHEVHGTSGQSIPVSLEQRTTWGLSGHNCWSSLLGRFDISRGANIAWAQALPGGDNSSLGGAIWGDGGQENQRQAQWHHYAHFAEVSWRGDEGADFPQRFCQTHYGVSSTQLAELLMGFPAFTPVLRRQAFDWFRQPLSALLRLSKATATTEDIHAFAQLAPTFAEYAQCIQQLIDNGARNDDHLQLWLVELARCSLLAERIQAVITHGLPFPSSVVSKLVHNVKQCRSLYRKNWLAHNRPEGLEISDSVYDYLLEDISQVSRKPATTVGCVCVPLPTERATFEAGIAGVPIDQHNAPGTTWAYPMAGCHMPYGQRHSTPFTFFGDTHTHISLQPGEELSLDCKPSAIIDCHLIASTPKGDETIREQLTVDFHYQGASIFTENLLSIKHLCDWWAPHGTHMWAGGGLAHVDPQRVRPIINIPNYTLSAVSRFPFVGTPTVDGITLRNCGENSVEIFALTLQLAPDYSE